MSETFGRHPDDARQPDRAAEGWSDADRQQAEAEEFRARFDNDGRPGSIIRMPEPARTPMSSTEVTALLGVAAIAAALIGFIVWVIAG